MTPESAAIEVLLAMRAARCLWLTLGLLPAALGCRTIESFVREVHIAIGAESSSVRFFTRRSKLEQQFGYRKSGDDPLREFHSVPETKTSFFYTISSKPSPVRILEEWGVNRVLAWSFTLNSPRTYRGVLQNYPDDGRLSADPWQALSFQLLPLQGAFGRKMDYRYEVAQAYGTVWLGYFGDNWYVTWGFNAGQSYYSLQIVENRFVLSDVDNKWRPLNSSSFALGYFTGRHFPEGIFSNTWVYLEASTESFSRGAVQTQLLRSDGTAPDALYVSSPVVRLGLRKVLDLAAAPASRNENASPEEQAPTDSE